MAEESIRDRRRVTMRDVARRAGVGTITVSRALAEPAKVSPSLRSRIESAVAELGYVPNRMAGGLSSKRSRMVPVIVPAIRNDVFADLVGGVNDVLLAEGYQILLGSTGYDPAREEALIAQFLGWSPEGLIIVGARHTEAAQRMLRETEATVVEAYELTPDPVEINVGFSNAAAAHDMAAHLVGRGYRRIAFVGAYMDHDVRADERRRGCTALLVERGLDDSRVLTYPERSDFGLGSRAVHDVLGRWPDTDAAFFANDVLAVGALLECQKCQIAVPGWLAIAGFNGLDIGGRTTPELTTVVSPRYEAGRAAARAILDRRQTRTRAVATIDLGYRIRPGASA